MLASADLLTAFVLFAFVSSITPGPNNTMLLASGVNFGVRRSIPHALGISVGFMVMVLAVGLGLGEVFKAWPALYTVLRYTGAAYLLYLAWKIATSGPVGTASSSARKPLGFWGAAAFQWVNPKAWVMAVTAMALYTDPDRPLMTLATVTLAFALVNLPCVSSWAAFGMALRNFLSEPSRLKWFNICMGIALAATLWPMLR